MLWLCNLGGSLVVMIYSIFVVTSCFSLRWTLNINNRKAKKTWSSILVVFQLVRCRFIVFVLFRLSLSLTCHLHWLMPFDREPTKKETNTMTLRQTYAQFHLKAAKLWAMYNCTSHVWWRASSKFQQKL